MVWQILIKIKVEFNKKKKKKKDKPNPTFNNTPSELYPKISPRANNSNKKKKKSLSQVRSHSS